MEFSGVLGIGALIVILLGADLLFHFAGEGLVLVTGSLIVRALSAGRIRCGEFRDISKDPNKPGGSALFYSENAEWFMYRNYVSLIGLAFWLLTLGAVFGYGMYVHAP